MICRPDLSLPGNPLLLSNEARSLNTTNSWSMRILFFAHLKNAAGRAAAEIHFGGEVDTDALWQRLLADYPGLTRYRASVRLARNNAYANAGTRFSDTDEVALIPPVSGG